MVRFTCRWRHTATALLSVVLLASCGSSSPGSSGSQTTQTTASTSTSTSSSTTSTTQAPATAIGERHIDLTDAGRGRALPTTIWYPARVSGEDATPAPGPYPVVLLSHGVGGLPADYQVLISGWVRAGFVVVAPAYPNTSRGSSVEVRDIVNQPADATFVLDSVLELATTAGDPLEGVLDGAHIAAVGHSGGGITTVGIFDACCRDPRVSAGIVLAGNGVGFGEPFSGAPAKLLFIHGDTDNVVPIALGRASFDADPWPKAFITLGGAGHLDPYLEPIAASFALVQRTTSDFLRWSLLDDQDALADLRTAVTGFGPAATLDDQLG